MIFDVDAKDLPIRSCNCDSVCEICLGEAKEIVSGIYDVLKSDLGLKNIHIIYSGRGYHIRVLDENVMEMDSNIRGQLVKYVTGAESPIDKYVFGNVKGGKPYRMDHFTIPIGYSKVFTERMKHSLMHITGKEDIEGLNPKLSKDIIKNREFLENNQWGLFKNKIGPIRYKRLVESMAKMNMSLVDAKVTIDLKRILRLPSSLHSKVSMKCMEVENIDSFEPLDDAVPKFVYERKEKKR